MFYYRVDDVLLFFLFCLRGWRAARQFELHKKAAVTHIAISQGYALHANNPRATHTHTLWVEFKIKKY